MNSLQPTILVVSADKSVQGAIHAACNAQSFRCLHAESGQTAQQLSSASPDLVIIYSKVPSNFGLDLFMTLRQMSCLSPFILVSEISDEPHIVQALDLGIRDYIIWPCGTAELIARIRRILRNNSQILTKNRQLRFDKLEIDLGTRNVKLERCVVNLTRKEFELLELFISHQGNVLTQPFILTRIWGIKTNPQYLRYYIKRLRSKLEPETSSRKYIETVAGVGYRFLSNS